MYVLALSTKIKNHQGAACNSILSCILVMVQEYWGPSLGQSSLAAILAHMAVECQQVDETESAQNSIHWVMSAASGIWAGCQKALTKVACFPSRCEKLVQPCPAHPKWLCRCQALLSAKKCHHLRHSS